MTDFTLAQLAVIAAAYFIAAFTKGLTGLGFSTTCLPFLVYAVGLKTALPLLLVASLSSNLIVMRDVGHFPETVRRFWPMFLAAVPGVVIGLVVLDSVDGPRAAAALGVVLVVYALFALRLPNLSLPARLERPLGPAVGLSTGFVNGLTGSQVMPVLPYLMALHLETNRFVQALNCSFTLSSLVMMLGLSHLGLFTLETAVISAAGILMVWLGVRAGGSVRRRLGQERFRSIVLLVLMGLGISLVVRAL